MKKIGMLVFIIMMMAVVTAVQAEVRAGGLPAVAVDDRINDCAACADSDKDGVPDNLDKCPNTPIGVTVDKDGCPVLKEKITITLNVEFDTAKAIVKQKYHDDIRRVADFMKTYTGTNAVIEGHTDNVGNAEYNDGLSKDRANSVRQYLIDKFGIDASRLTAVGYGLNRPIADNNTDEGRQKNRRVEAVIETVKIK
ncbi:MAG: OmpA family protein [Deltaproteobacteria bacterium]|nr:OmpA family protein [Deltaproteobacteria bacterium]